MLTEPAICLLPAACWLFPITAVLSAARRALVAPGVMLLHQAPAASGASPARNAPPSGRHTCGWVEVAAAGRCADVGWLACQFKVLLH